MEAAMELTGQIASNDWTVAAQSSRAGSGYAGLVTIRMHGTEPPFERSFCRETLFLTQGEAVLAALKEGMILIELAMAKTITFLPNPSNVNREFEPTLSTLDHIET
jgi:hypothetical protein